MQKPLILAVETSGRYGSVAIAQADKLINEAEFSKPLKHSSEIIPVISELVKSYDKKPEEITHIYISIGPGSFTGLRIAVTLAKTIHLANNAKIVPVNTLDVIAQNATDKIVDRIGVVIDAKRGQFFIAVYKYNESKDSQETNHQIWSKISHDSLMTAQQFQEKFANPKQPIRLLGEGLVYYKDRFEAPGVSFFDDSYWYPTAANVHRLGWYLARGNQFADPLTLVPNYLRKPDVKKT